MSEPSPSAEESPERLNALADAMEAAVEAAKQGVADARETASEAVPVATKAISNLVYKMAYGVSYGVVFPSVLIARSLPQDNPIAHGFIDGARAAIDMVDEMKGKTTSSESSILGPDGAPVSLAGQS